VPFVEAAGLVGPEHVHCRGASIPSHPYKKIESLLQTFSVVVSLVLKEGDNSYNTIIADWCVEFVPSAAVRTYVRDSFANFSLPIVLKNLYIYPCFWRERERVRLNWFCATGKEC